MIQTTIIREMRAFTLKKIVIVAVRNDFRSEIILLFRELSATVHRNLTIQFRLVVILRHIR